MKIQFRDSAIHISSTADGDLAIAADDEIDITSTLIDINGNVDISGTLAQADAITMATNKKIIFRDAAIHISSTADGDLSIAADDEIDLTSTLIDINGNVEISGTAVTTGVHTFTAVPVFPNNTVETADIQDDAITAAKIADNAVVTAGINADAVTGAEIADDAIDSEHYTDGSIDTAHIGADQITNAKIADDQIDSEHYANASIDTAHIGNLQITAALLAADAVETAKITASAVTTAKIAADNIVASLIADNAINSEHYTDGSIDTAHIADVNVTQGKIADQAINEAKMQISNAPSNGARLTAQSGNTGGLTWDVNNVLVAFDSVSSYSVLYNGSGTINANATQVAGNLNARDINTVDGNTSVSGTWRNMAGACATNSTSLWQRIG